jgi:cell division protein FtsA
MASQSPLIIAGIDMGSSTTRVVITEHTETDAQPRVIGIGKMETMGISKGYVVHEAEAVQSLLQAITRAEKMAGVQLERAYISIGGISLETHHITTQIELTKREITDRDISMLRYQVTNEFSHPTNERITEGFRRLLMILSLIILISLKDS